MVARGYGGDLSTGGDGFGGAVDRRSIRNRHSHAERRRQRLHQRGRLHSARPWAVAAATSAVMASAAARASMAMPERAAIDNSLYGAADGYGGDGNVDRSGEIGGNGSGRERRGRRDERRDGGRGYASVSTNGYGGNGDRGGKGTGGGVYTINTGTGADGAHIFAENGSIILGGASVSSDGYGGDAGYYYGGGTGGDGGDGAAAGLRSSPRTATGARVPSRSRGSIPPPMSAPTAMAVTATSGWTAQAGCGQPCRGGDLAGGGGARWKWRRRWRGREWRQRQWRRRFHFQWPATAR